MESYTTWNDSLRQEGPASNATHHADCNACHWLSTLGTIMCIKNSPHTLDEVMPNYAQSALYFSRSGGRLGTKTDPWRKFGLRFALNITVVAVRNILYYCRLQWQRLTTDRPGLSSERAPQKDNTVTLKENLWSKVPDWARHQDILTGWPSVVM
jgi:hypothetical protein